MIYVDQINRDKSTRQDDDGGKYNEKRLNSFGNLSVMVQLKVQMWVQRLEKVYLVPLVEL